MYLVIYTLRYATLVFFTMRIYGKFDIECCLLFLDVFGNFCVLDEELVDYANPLVAGGDGADERGLAPGIKTHLHIATFMNKCALLT